MRSTCFLIATLYVAIGHATLPLWPLPSHVETGSEVLWMTPDVTLSFEAAPKAQNLAGWLWNTLQLPEMFVVMIS
jgi:hypothetical protein